MATRFRTEDFRRGVVDQAQKEIEAAAGHGKVLSRAEQAKLADGPRQAAEAVRADKGPGAKVAAREVVTAYDAAVTAALAAVNSQGPAWISAAETRQIADADLRGRVWNVRAQLGAGLSDAALETRMALHVVKNAEPSPFERTERPFPGRAGGRGCSRTGSRGPEPPPWPRWPACGWPS